MALRSHGGLSAFRRRAGNPAAPGRQVSDMADFLAVMNAGSSSIKFAVYESADDARLLFRGQVEKIGLAPRLRVADADGRQITDRSWPENGFDHAAATRAVIDEVRARLEGNAVKALGHRVVHGGTFYAAPVLVDPSVLLTLDSLCSLAPLHQRHNLAPIKAVAETAPHIVQVACFDTAFHRRQPMVAQIFALPRKFTEAGVRRYGFHGLSYEYVVARMAQLCPDLSRGRMVIAHLGSGASLCAVEHGRSIASTMGFTAVDGLVMGTRTGSIDPGALIYLMDSYDMGPRDLEDLIYRRSGLLGVSGISSDMRSLRESSSPAAAEAIDLFVYRVVREIGSLAAALGGLDALVFTGGIGQHDAATRAQIVQGCTWLGAALHDKRNAEGREGRISTDDAALSLWVVPTDEECMVARHMIALLASN